MKVDPQIIIDACKDSMTMAEASLKVTQINFQTFRKYAIKLGVWNPNPSGKGTQKPKEEGKQKFHLKDILDGKHPSYSSHKLRLRLIKDGIKQNRCECCGIDNIWNGKELSMQLDHINGNPRDNRLENLRILCPNCHTQTNTHGSKKLKLGDVA